MQFPRISLITPSYNQATYLEACIDSILSQNYPNLEYMILDGGSSDGSIQIIERHSKYLSYWRSHPDDGHYAAVNEGLTRSSGEIMAWLNSDDMLHPRGLFVAAEVFMEHPKIEFLTARVANFDTYGNTWEAPIPLIRWCRESLLRRENLDERRFLTVTQETTLWRRSLWERAGGTLDLSFKLAADFELWARFSRYAQLHTVDERIGGFRSHSEGQRSRCFLGDYKKECLSIIDREHALNLPNEPIFKNAPPTLILDARKQVVTKAFTPKVFPLVESNPGYPKASVVTVCKKEDLYLAQCIESVLSQNYPNLEYIVINCGNSDTNLQVLNTYKEHLLILDSPEELSRFEALQVGLNHCSGEMITWLWPEDIHNEKALLYAAGILFRNKDIEWIVGHPSAVDDNGDIVYVDLLPAVYARRNWLQLNVVQPFIYQESMFWKKSLWEKSGATLNTQWKHAVDFELFLRFSRYAEVQSINFLLSSHRRNAESRYSKYPVEYLQEVVLIVEQERASCPLTPFDEKVPPVPIVELK